MVVMLFSHQTDLVVRVKRVIIINKHYAAGAVRRSPSFVCLLPGIKTPGSEGLDPADERLQLRRPDGRYGLNCVEDE